MKRNVTLVSSDPFTDAAGHFTTFRYDALGRRVGRTLPAGQSESSAYDLTGNLVYQTNFNGMVITNQYDTMNRLLKKTSTDGSFLVSFAYNATNGLRTNMTDVTGVTAYQYDNLNRLTQKAVAWTNGPAVSLNYGYDATGLLTNLWSSTANGVSNAYQYDVLGRLTNVLAGGSAAAGYGFDAVGNLQAANYGNGVTNLYQYDSRNRLTNLVWKLNGSTLANFAYTLGPTGNRTALAESLNGTSRSYGWTYDLLYRLTGETMSGIGAVNYQFDTVGNRTNRISNITGLNYQSPSYNSNDWVTSDSYDNNGNTTASSGTAYQYDVMNHLTNANTGGVVIGYDGDGNRVEETVSGTTTYYLLGDRDPSGYVQVLEEYQSSSLSVIYNYGLELISQKQSGSGAVRYFGYDGHGSTRFLTYPTGTVSDTYVFDAYGNKIASASTGSSANSYLYCGEQFDNALSFYYLRARYYKPDTGRFWTMDSFDGRSEDPLSLHKYLYCQADPVNGFDPSGLDKILVVGDGGGVGTSGAAKSAGTHFENAGWTVQYMTSDEWANFVWDQRDPNNPSQHFQGIILAGHGEATIAGGVTLDNLTKRLDQSHDKMRVLMALACHGNEFVAPLIQKGYTSTDALIISYVGYNYNNPATEYRVGKAIDKWVKNPTYTEVLEKKLVADGFGTVGVPIWQGVGFFFQALTGGMIGW